jgi:long-chain acyl-CoA synthetase
MEIPIRHFRFGTVGKPLPGVEVRIGEDSEIQVRGPIMMKGYDKKPEATAEVFTPDGWFRTRDAGLLEDGVYLRTTERLKDLIKTVGGEITPTLKIRRCSAEARNGEVIEVMCR